MADPTPDEVAEEIRMLTAAVEADPQQLAFRMGLRPPSVMQMCAIMQLAQRHEGLPDGARLMIVRFLEAAREYFKDYPKTLWLIAAGDDPAQDLTAAEVHALFPERPQEAGDLATAAALIARGLYATDRLTPTIRAIAREYLNLRHLELTQAHPSHRVIIDGVCATCGVEAGHPQAREACPSEIAEVEVTKIPGGEA
jgi:hypothetical protein